ncbi:Phosphate import ATP-binding protein PstB 3 [bacterium HR17]|jgi:phosphate transport system ATP-binding protein|uniref:Phosphate import ATP-binding protein PstB 3 n=1 Tax=Candidatus Fervidibacter japonicus TaxID=2035412 RepID=A0A2H5XCB7_9BACT|nr:Phosphate import ATP-binding protein PstB 3 [bacterium HR17]
MPHIVVRNLSVAYDGYVALRDVTVEIPDGQITVVLGPSGCGKTTFLRCLNRLIDLTEGAKVTGEVLIDGENILAPDADILRLRKKMGMLQQKPTVLPMSIYDNIAFGAWLHGVRDKRGLDEVVERCLRMVHLWDEVKDRLKAPATQLSIGQQQRLCLARSLAVAPEVLLCDEPTSALDPISAQHIENLFRQLRGTYTLIIVTHTLRQAKRLADYGLFFYMGELVEHGAAADIFSAPRDERTRAFLAGVIG